MVLGCDLYFAGPQIFDGLISAAMAKFQFESRPAQGQPKNLVSETNSENRQPCANQLAHRLDRITECRRISRSIGKENAGGFVGKGLSRWRCSRQHLNLKAVLAQSPQDIVLHSKIVSDDGDVSRGQRTGLPSRAHLTRALNQSEFVA